MTQYYYDTKDMEKAEAGRNYSTAVGTWVEGERIIFGDICIPAGTKAEPHSHPNEQFIIVLQGRVRYDIEGDVKVVEKGEIVHIPPNIVHSAEVVGDEDFLFITAKDTSWGIHGNPANSDTV